MSFQDYIDELDNKAEGPDYRKIALIGAALVVLIGLIVVFVGFSNSADASTFEVVESASSDASDQTDVEESSTRASVCVYVTGCVAHPGVVYLDEGARVADAIEACGGMLEQASAESLNLARIVVDGEQIDVISQEEAAAAAMAASASSSASNGASASSAASAGGKVNINTADVSEFQTLSGIGESKAKKIVEYRESNGPFKSIDDLSNVSGIGDKTVDSLRDSVCI